jgi:hypothetical protein
MKHLPALFSVFCLVVVGVLTAADYNGYALAAMVTTAKSAAVRAASFTHK